ncbi:MAG TPA: universal stress protein [Tepidisphaeraceae bacterium]|nr:universal stress protein [Tepidisphaeraceae bacterium]
MEDRSDPLPPALALLNSERPRNVNWFQAGALLFGDWGTSRLYVLGLAFLVAGRSSFLLIAAMSLLILVVGWAYTHICRLYPDGGGVYTAGRRRARILGVIGALLLFADYTITASLSSVEAFHYFGLGKHEQHAAQVAQDPGDAIVLPEEQHAADEAAAKPKPPQESLWHLNSPGLWAIVSILALGAFNLLGPKHTSAFAIFAAVGMVAITLLIVVFALPQVNWSQVQWGQLWQPPLRLWQGFVYIVLALSGVEAISNLTGVMTKPVFQTARRSIYVVAIEVAVFNLILAAVMVALSPPRDAHKEDMLAYMAGQYIGAWGEWPVRILGGLLLLSATNTAVNGLMSILYVMSRDRELPAVLQKLNGFGAPWLGAVVAASVPAVVLLFFHDLETLASLYAIGVVGAVALNCTLGAIHPRMRRAWRKAAILGLGAFLGLVWITLALTKLHALAFVTIVLAVGLSARAVTRWAQARRPKPSLLRQAIIEQLPPEAWSRPRIMLATAGSDELAIPAMEIAQAQGATLVVTFIREVALNYRVEAERRLTLDTDPAALALFTDFLAHGHNYGVPVIPVYDTGPNGAELLAEHAAMNGVARVLIGSSRRGALHHLIKGSFQRRLEALLPPDVRVEVLNAPTFTPPTTAAA